MVAKFKNLTWEKGTINFMNPNSYGHLPSNAVRTSYGNYIVPNPAKLYLTLLTEDGRTITLDIVDVVKDANGWEKISEKRYNNLRNRLAGKKFQIDEDDNVVDLDGMVMF